VNSYPNKDGKKEIRAEFRDTFSGKFPIVGEFTLSLENGNIFCRLITVIYTCRHLYARTTDADTGDINESNINTRTN